MYAWFRKLKSGLVKSDINQYIGSKGEMFHHNETGEFRISDGVTPGGLPIAVFLSTLRNVRDIDFDGIQNKQVLTYDQTTNKFVWGDISLFSPKYTKYISGFEYTIPKTEHGIAAPSAVTVYDPSGVEVSTAVSAVDGNITISSNVLLDNHWVVIS